MAATTLIGILNVGLISSSSAAAFLAYAILRTCILKYSASDIPTVSTVVELFLLPVPRGRGVLCYGFLVTSAVFTRSGGSSVFPWDSLTSYFSSCFRINSSYCIFCASACSLDICVASLALYHAYSLYRCLYRSYGSCVTNATLSSFLRLRIRVSF